MPEHAVFQLVSWIVGGGFIIFGVVMFIRVWNDR